jgi:hypothetical protein
LIQEFLRAADEPGMRPPSSVSLGIDPRARMAQAVDRIGGDDAALYAERASGWMVS